MPVITIRHPGGRRLKELLVENAKELHEKRVLRVFGSVPSVAQKDHILKLVQRRAGDQYMVMDNLFVSELPWDG